MKRPARLSFAATLLLVVAIATLPSTMACGQSPNPLYQHLPPSANHIYSVRLGQVIAKGELLPILGSLPNSKDSNFTAVLDILKNPASIGVDINHEILIAQTTASGEGADTLSFIQVLVPLTDSAKFRAFFHKNSSSLHIRKVPGKGVTISNGKECTAWNDRLLVITHATFEMPGADSTHKKVPEVRQPLRDLLVDKSLAALAGFPNNPLLADQRFIAGFSTDEDMHAWSTKMDFMSMISKFAKKMAAKNPAMHGKPLPDYGNMSRIPHPPVLSTFNFENGRIAIRITTFSKPEDADVLHRLYDRPINTELLARVPGGLLLGCAALHFNAAAVGDVMDKYGSRPMLDSMLGKKGLSLSDITPVFGGDFMVAVLADTSATSDTAKPKINFYVVATLGDPAKMMQLAGKLASGNGAAIGDTAAMAKMKKLADKIVVRDNTLVISGSKEMANKYFDNHDRRSTSLLDEGNSTYAMAIDLKAVSKFAAASMSDNPKAMLIARVLERLEKIELTSKMDGNNTVLTFQIVTGDTSTNSLKTLVGLLH
jgi:hypothetical protein